MAKRKDAPSSVLTRSGRKTSTGKQATTNPLNTRKSPRFQKQMAPTPSTVKKKPQKSEKQMGSAPLRRSERGKNHARKSPRFQESREVAPALLGNPLEAESHDKPMHDMINQEKAHDITPSVQQVASVSDHSMPEIPVGYMHSQNL
uniref:Helicase protein MOM1-like n=1 Tax=Tanacetum cinerariifolium TaxID=118510 RepID=A0A699S2R9_TANCI|nr:helicase protein MOM1-like [Tanacetum cinerariifolium]GFC91714.1 helicase protein MOM1-like [Tanacetum cinerariifolium]